MHSLQPDNELVKQAANGNTEAFSILVERYRQKVFQTCMGFLHNPYDAEDLTQEIFLKAWHALTTFDGRSAFGTWLYRIAVNKAINQTRKKNFKSLIRINDEITESKHSNENAENNMLRKEQKDLIKRAINKLKSNHKKAFVLFYYQELSVNEVAEVLKMSPKAAESLVFRARKNLQKFLTR